MDEPLVSRLAPEHLSPSVLLGLQEIMQDEYAQLLDAFLTDLLTRQSQLQQAYECCDAEALRRGAHSFKGSCGNLGAHKLAELCCQLEEAGLNRQFEHVPALLEQTRRECAIVGILMRAERQRFTGA